MRLLRHFAVLCTFAIVIAVIGEASRSLHIRQEFYGVVAQVLPVFLLVIAVEGRFFAERPQHGPLRRLIVEYLLVVALLGEFSALIAVAQGSATDTVRGGVLTGLLLVALLFGAMALIDPLEARRQDRR
jgi:RsiW-degrading membrane proteinase PrsW (M82 family)